MQVDIPWIPSLPDPNITKLKPIAALLISLRRATDVIPVELIANCKLYDLTARIRQKHTKRCCTWSVLVAVMHYLTIKQYFAMPVEFQATICTKKAVVLKSMSKTAINAIKLANI